MNPLLLILPSLLSLTATGVMLALLLNARRTHADELRRVQDRLHSQRVELNECSATISRLLRRLRAEGLDADAHRSGRSEAVVLNAHRSNNGGRR